MTLEPKRRLSPQLRRGQLLDVALQLAAGRDLTAVSVQEIAAEAGVSEGLLYYYFPTKDALLVAAVQRAADAMAAAVVIAAQGPPMDALRAGLAAYLDHVQNDSTGWRALLQARVGPLADVAARVEEQSRALTLGVLGVEAPSRTLAAALEGWAALERQLCLDWLDHSDLPRTAIEDLLLSTFLAALQAAARHDEQALQVFHQLTMA